LSNGGQEVNYRPGRLRALWRTTIGKKYVVAITGVILAAYVVLHMLGNLKSLQGAGGGEPAIDRYAEWLRDFGDPLIPHEGVLWAFRAVLLVALVLHVVAIVQLGLRNRAAVGPGHHRVRQNGTIAARTMQLSGLVILGFVVFHILHFTTGTIHPGGFTSGEIYGNLDAAFGEWWVVVIYVFVLLLLGMHLHHALWSGAQTAGVDNPDRNWFWRRLATVVTVAVVVGFASVPILFSAGALPEPTESHAESRPAP